MNVKCTHMHTEKPGAISVNLFIRRHAALILPNIGLKNPLEIQQGNAKWMPKDIPVSLSRCYPQCSDCAYACGNSKVVRVFKVVCLLGVVCGNGGSQALGSTHTRLTVCPWMPECMINANAPRIQTYGAFYITVSLKRFIHCLYKTLYA